MGDKNNPSRLVLLKLTQELNPSTLAVVTEEELEAADEDGFLAGNQEYQDLRSLGFDDLTFAIEREAALLAHLFGSADSAGVETSFLAARSPDDERGALWNLDIGVASATVALVVAGAHPFLSCNGGTFGTWHPREFPIVKFYIGDLEPERLLDWARQAKVGLSEDDGIVTLYSNGVEPLFAFGELVHRALSPRVPPVR